MSKSSKSIKTSTSKSGRKPLSHKLTLPAMTPSQAFWNEILFDGAVPAIADPNVDSVAKQIELRWNKYVLTWVACRADAPDAGEFTDAGPDDPSIHEFCKHLIAIGGSKVCLRFTDSFQCGPYKTYGQLVTASTVKLKKGQPCRCHVNTAELWDKSKGKHTIMSGYVLSGDMWLDHSWLVTEEGELLETTELRDKYFGVRLEGEKAIKFYYCNLHELPPHLVDRAKPVVKAKSKKALAKRKGKSSSKTKKRKPR